LIDTYTHTHIQWAEADLDREAQRRKRKREKEVDPMIGNIKMIENTAADLHPRKIGKIILTIKIERMIPRIITMMLSH